MVLLRSRSMSQRKTSSPASTAGAKKRASAVSAKKRASAVSAKKRASAVSAKKRDSAVSAKKRDSALRAVSAKKPRADRNRITSAAAAAPSAGTVAAAAAAAPPAPSSPQSAGNFSAWLQLTRQAQLLPTVGSDVPCGSCNGCCRASYFIHIRPEEKATLARIPRELLFAAPGAPPGHLLMGYDERGRCPMLSDAGCTIYEHRPQTCRDFDCRVFAATGIALDAEGPQAGIAAQVQRWRFELGNEAARRELSAVRAAAAFLQQRHELFAPDALPKNPAQLAALAIRVVGLFEELQDGERAQRGAGQRGAGQPIAGEPVAKKRSDTELARAVMAALNTGPRRDPS